MYLGERLRNFRSHLYLMRFNAHLICFSRRLGRGRSKLLTTNSEYETFAFSFRDDLIKANRQRQHFLRSTRGEMEVERSSFGIQQSTDTVYMKYKGLERRKRKQKENHANSFVLRRSETDREISKRQTLNAVHARIKNIKQAHSRAADSRATQR